MSWPGTRQLRDLVSQALYATDCYLTDRHVQANEPAFRATLLLAWRS